MTKHNEIQCTHDFTKWSRPFNSVHYQETSPSYTVLTSMVKQERICKLCRLIEVNNIRGGKVEEGISWGPGIQEKLDE